MERLERIIQLDEWILSPHVKVIVGDDTSVIYDFGKTKAYQVNKLVGVFLNTVFNNKDVSKLIPRWRITSQSEKLPDETINELNACIAKLKKLDVLIHANEYQRKEPLISASNDVLSKPPLFCIIELTSRCNFFVVIVIWAINFLQRISILIPFVIFYTRFRKWEYNKYN